MLKNNARTRSHAEFAAFRPMAVPCVKNKKALRRAFHQCKAEVLAVAAIAAGAVASAIAIIAGAIGVVTSDLILCINAFFCSFILFHDLVFFDV